MCKLLDGPSKRHGLGSSCLCGLGIGKRDEEKPMDGATFEAFEKYLDGAHDVSIHIQAMRQLFDEVKRSRSAVDAETLKLAREIIDDLEKPGLRPVNPNAAAKIARALLAACGVPHGR